MYHGLGSAALLAPPPSMYGALPRNAAVGARLASLRAFAPRSAYLATFAVPGFATEADPRVELEALINQVLDAHAEARAAIARVGVPLATSTSEANAALTRIRAWKNDNSAEIQALSQLPPDTVVPDNVRLRMPPEEAKAFIAAVWYDATVGLGLFQTGFAIRAMEQGDPDWSYNAIKSDLQSRLQSFRLILGMDADGTLAPAMTGRGTSVGGALGEPLSTGTILLILGIVAIVVAAFAYIADRGYDKWLRWRMFEQTCDRARAEKDTATIEACRNTVTDIPKPTDPATVAILVVGGVALVWLLATFTLPRYLNK